MLWSKLEKSEAIYVFFFEKTCAIEGFFFLSGSPSGVTVGQIVFPSHFPLSLLQSFANNRNEM